MNTTRIEHLTLETQAPAIDPALGEQFNWHRKPEGWGGAPCPVCGCQAKRLKARYRALSADEAWKAGYRYVKQIKVCFGLDWPNEPVGR